MLVAVLPAVVPRDRMGSSRWHFFLVCPVQKLGWGVCGTAFGIWNGFYVELFCSHFRGLDLLPELPRLMGHRYTDISS